MVGAQDQVEPDSHAAFDELFGAPKPTKPRPAMTPEEREERMRLVASLASIG